MPHVQRSPLVAALLTAVLALGLAACSVTFTPVDRVDATRPTPPTETVRPQPSAMLPGDGSILQFEVTPNNIHPSTRLVFRTRFARAGYLTVSAMAPNGRVDVLMRNVPVAPGFQLVPPLAAAPSERIQASGPFGRWVLRAQFSEVRTEARYQNLQGYDAWTVAVANDLRGTPNASLFETAFEVAPR